MWICDDDAIVLEGTDDDTESKGTCDMLACDEIIVLEGFIIDDIDSEETCDGDTCDEVMVFEGIDDDVDGKETGGVAGTCDGAIWKGITGSDGVDSGTSCCVFVMFSGGGLSGTSNCSKSSIISFSMFFLVLLSMVFFDVFFSPNNFLFLPITEFFPVIMLVNTDLLSSVT